MGCDWIVRRSARRLSYFNPRIPYGMRHLGTWQVSFLWKFQSTHPVWDATLDTCTVVSLTIISIHASRMGCDRCARPARTWTTYFNPRIPYGMRRKPFRRHAMAVEISIHASRMGCDGSQARHSHWPAYFNPRIPYGMRPRPPAPENSPRNFNPRIPYGMRHGLAQPRQRYALISIHASRMGCDTIGASRTTAAVHFNPRIPYGMRHD